MIAPERGRQPSPAHPMVVERTLRVTNKPVRAFGESEGRGALASPRADEGTTYYLCGECEVILGHTPGFQMASRTVVACPNCGAHNEL